MIEFVKDDGGREAAGFKGHAGDCVVRAVAIASGLPYRRVYDDLAALNAGYRKTKRAKRVGVKSARNGNYMNRDAFKRYMRDLGFEWTACMSIGSGTTVHLVADELPAGRLVVRLSRHAAAVIDGVLHDSYNSGEERHESGVKGGEPYERSWARAVYGYWRKVD